jgi:putative endonuclease
VIDATAAASDGPDGKPAAPGDDAWAVYLIECTDGRVYTGIARDPHSRYVKHLSGKGARFTRSNPPRALLGWVWVADKSAALRLEMAWKKLPREKRLAALADAATLVPQP